ncbi:hypothetical protein J6590_037306 [Homalodisca vitripennis]|nr:hypothetical protein J6590_037306 [Homalodisca vitripennis]
MKHKFRVNNQSKFLKYVRTNLNDDEVFIVVDFSENYQLKYSSEIQSRHFGASNEQLALHTGYYNFSEAGHGKSIADGVGGTVKRTADSAVPLGKHVANIEQFLASVGNMRPLILQVEGASMIEVDDIKKKKHLNLLPIKNTMMLHQVVWNSQDGPKKLNCSFCRA